jgi:enamine deaminase RidA (YjgF/YER057c/UK114 family)
MTTSWRRKVDRAEEHLRDFVERITPFQERRTYPVSEGFEGEGDERHYVRRVNFPEPHDPMLAILAGEIMFNARSALDHLAAALVPASGRTRRIVKDTQFPIFSVDVDEVDPLTGKHAHRNERANFERMTKGFPARAVPLVKGLQPYMLSPKVDPAHHAFSILADLQNADKHRQLVIVATGLEDPVIRHITPSGLVVYESDVGGLPADRILQNGAAVDRSPDNDLSGVDVEVEGTLALVVGEGGDGPYYPCPHAFEQMLLIARRAFERLEKFVEDP